jgi:vitamin B12 transporter
MNKRILSFCALGLICTLGYSQQSSGLENTQVNQLEAVVVSDSRFELKRENSGKTIITITAEELQRNQGRSLAELINTKTGIEINGSRSNAGQNLSYLIRGGNNRQVLFLIDGIPVSDPSQVAGDFDLKLVDPASIESVEILKGAASTLYGNSAATAVINIKTKKAGSERISASFQSSIGSNQSSDESDYSITDFRNNLNVNGRLDKFSYLVGFGHQYTDGLSAVIGEEKDPFNRINTNVNFGYQFSDRLSVNILGYYDKFKADFDAASPMGDNDNYSQSEQYRVTISPEYRYNNGQFNINASFNEIHRDIYSEYPNAYAAKSTVVDAYNKYSFNDKFYTIIGLNYIKRQATLGADTDFTTTDPYANVVWVSDFGLNLNLGGRWNNHSEYGSHFTYNFNPSYTLKLDSSYLKFLGSYSSSYIAPTLPQLFGAFGANPDLKPEENHTLEGGVEFQSEQFRWSALYFNREEENFIDYMIAIETGQWMYVNVEDRFTVHGLELEASYEPIAKLLITANYTFTENRDKVVLRIPKHKANAGVNYQLFSTTGLGLSYQYTGARSDTDFDTFENVELDAFSLLNFSANHQFSDQFSMFLNLDNITNEDYQELVGYTTRGRNVRLGFRLTL